MAIICITPKDTPTVVPHIIYDFLANYHYLREPPCNKKLFESIARQHNINPSVALKLYTNKIYHSIQTMTPKEMDFIEQVISDGYESYMEETGHKRSWHPIMTSISVKLTDECPYKQDGSTFYVFPASYSEYPVIHL